MPQLIAIGGIMIIVLLILVLSIFLEPIFSYKRPFFRLVFAKDQYIIQYRKFLWKWETYTIPGTGEPAVYYSKSEAEGMIKTLVDRRNKTNDLNKLTAKKVEVFEYDTKGNQTAKKESWK